MASPDSKHSSPMPSGSGDAAGDLDREIQASSQHQTATDTGLQNAGILRPSDSATLSRLLVPDDIAGSTRRHEMPLLHSPTPAGTPVPPTPTVAKRSLSQRIRHTWLVGKGMVLVMIAQFFGSSMNVMTRTLEMDGPHGKAMHPFQILLVRMLGTVICSAFYMWYNKVPQPFGAPSVRPLLVLRGISGFFGVFGLYYSLIYLPLSEATVLTFLAPILCCYACSLVIPGEVFTGKQQIAGVVSLLGVILIARPRSLFASQVGDSPEAAAAVTSEFISVNPSNTTAVFGNSPSQDVDPGERLLAVLAALMGVLGATTAYTTIRKIGQRAHPLVSVTYFSVMTTIISTAAILIFPSVKVRFPSNWTEFLLLSGLAACGFLLQFLLTAGLAYVPPQTLAQQNDAGAGGAKRKPSAHGSRATSMVYTQMLFALFYDRLVWNSTPSPLSWAGSGIILGSAIYVALQHEGGEKGGKAANVKPGQQQQGGGGGEAAAMDIDDEDALHADVEHEAGAPGARTEFWKWRWSRRASLSSAHEQGHEEERAGLLDDPRDSHEDDDEQRAR